MSIRWIGEERGGCCMMQRGLGSCQFFSCELALEIQSTVSRTEYSKVLHQMKRKNQSYNPEHKTVWDNTTEQTNTFSSTQQKFTVPTTQLRQQAEIFWGGWWSLLLVSADKFSPSYSLHEPQYLTQAVVLTPLPLKQTTLDDVCLGCSAGDQTGLHARGRRPVVVPSKPKIQEDQRCRSIGQIKSEFKGAFDV